MRVDAAAIAAMDPSGPCVLVGNSDMYGLGIRAGFYLTWSAGLLASFLGLPEEVLTLRITITTFTGATLVALIVQTAQGKLAQADVYITLLMCFGYYYFWLLSTIYVAISLAIKTDWEPPELSIVESSDAYKFLNIIMLLTVSSYQLWFWIAGVYRLPTGMLEGCSAYGFAFSRVPLTGTPIRGLNLALLPLMVLLGVISATIQLKSARRRWEVKRHLKKVQDKGSDEDQDRDAARDNGMSRPPSQARALGRVGTSHTMDGERSGRHSSSLDSEESDTAKGVAKGTSEVDGTAEEVKNDASHDEITESAAHRKSPSDPVQSESLDQQTREYIARTGVQAEQQMRRRGTASTAASEERPPVQPWSRRSSVKIRGGSVRESSPDAMQEQYDPETGFTYHPLTRAERDRLSAPAEHKLASSSNPSPRRKSKKKSDKTNKKPLRVFQTIVSVVTAIFVTMTELSVAWNHVQGVDTLDSAGQLIPFFIGLATFSHVLWSWHKKRKEEEGEKAHNAEEEKEKVKELVSVDEEKGLTEKHDIRATRVDSAELERPNLPVMPPPWMSKGPERNDPMRADGKPLVDGDEDYAQPIDIVPRSPSVASDKSVEVQPADV